jgi:hypothetical protein
MSTNSTSSLAISLNHRMKIVGRILIALLCVFSLAGVRSATAQGNTSMGTDFWVGFMPNFSGGRNVTQLFLASGTANTVKVTVGNSTTKYTLAANTAITADLNGLGVDRTPEVATSNGVHITSTAPLTVYGYNVWDGGAGFLGGSPDGFLALPTAALGTKYYTVNYYDGNFAGVKTVGEFVIVAPQDNTTVTITVKAHTKDASGAESHQPGDKWTVTLMKGQTYMVQSTGNYIGDDDLTGSLVESSKPVAVLSGHQISAITVDMSSADHLLEMPPPVDKWGTQYFDMPMAGRTRCGDYIRIMSGEDGNQITYNGNGPFSLNAGEWAELPTTLVATVFKSINHKKFLVTQYSYSQGFNGDPGLADPFMILMTAQEQFEKRMIFRTPLPAKNGSFVNYLTVISQLDSLYTIKINKQGITSYGAVGQQSFPGTNPVMAAIRVKIPGGSNSYVATANVPFGMYQYGFSDYEGYGWPTGQAVNVVSPDTLPPLESRIGTCGNYTAKLIEGRHQPKFSFEDTRIAEVSMITEVADPRWSKPAINYLFTLDPNFYSGDSTASYTLSVIDPLQDAYAAIYTVDRAGNDTVYEYIYAAPKITLSPAPPFAFGSVLVQSDSCQTITITNAAKQPVNLFGTHIMGKGKGGIYKLTPASLTKTLAPGETAQLTICYTPNDTGIVNATFDSLVVGLDCDSVIYALSGQGITPLIYTADLNFGVVDTGKTKCMDMKVSNKGTAPLTITKADLLNNADFSVDAAQVFPIVIQPGQSVMISYCFHPTHNGSFNTLDIFKTLNPQMFLHSIKDTSILIGQSFGRGALLTSYDLDLSTICTSKNRIVDTIYDPLTVNSENIDSVSITGPDAASFRVVSFTPGNGSYPVVLDPAPAPGVAYTLEFDPTVKGVFSGVRTAFFNAYGHSGEHLVATLKADSKAPQLVVTPGAATTINLGTTLITQVLNGTFTVQNTGNDVLNIGSITVGGADAANFTVAPQGPYTLTPGKSQIETITFTAGNAAREYDATFSINPTGTNCATLATQPVKASASSTSYDALGADYKLVFTCRQKDLTGEFDNHSSSETASLISVSIENNGTWQNASDFQLAPPLTLPMNVGPNAKVTVPVRFSPTAIGPRSAALMFIYVTPSGTDTLIRELQGIGDNIQEVIGAGNVTARATYSGKADDPITVPLIMSKPFASTNSSEVFGYGFKVTWRRDAFRYTTIDAPTGITLSEVGSAIFDPVTGTETRQFRGTSPNPLTNETTLGTLRMQVMLDTDKGTAIVPSDVVFYDQQGTVLCYVASTQVDGAFNFDAKCGDASIAAILRGDRSPLSISVPTPNPFRGETTIGFTLRNSDATVTMNVFDALGNPVAMLVDHVQMKVGSYTTKFDATSLATGAYFIRISDGTNIATRRVLLAK